MVLVSDESIEEARRVGEQLAAEERVRSRSMTVGDLLSEHIPTYEWIVVEGCCDNCESGGFCVDREEGRYVLRARLP